MHVASSPAALMGLFGFSGTGPEPAFCASGTCVTIGNFDGVHLGHRQLIESARRKAESLSKPGARVPLVVVTFDPHPLEVLAPAMAPPRLTDTATRLRLLDAAGVDGVLLLPFTPALATMPPDTFVHEMLVQGLCLRALHTGYDFSMGKGRTGNAAVLGMLGQQWNFSVERVGPLMAGAEPISSTRIRQCIRNADMQGAAALLGRPHSVHGTVIQGHQRGRLLGFPTANLPPPPVQLPPIGVYATWVRLGIEHFPAVTNVGHNPTFGGEHLTVETHVIDFSRNLYGVDIEIDFIKHLRDQIKFDSADALVQRIQQDVCVARSVLFTHTGGGKMVCEMSLQNG